MPASGVRAGVVMVLVSAASFGTIPILAKFAYAGGMTPLQLLTYRFLIAAVGLTAIALATGQAPSRVGWARALPLFAVGLFFYAGMAGAFFGALTQLPASLAELIAYLYPALVAAGAWAFFGGEMDRRVVVALGASFAGLALLVGAIELRGGVALVLAFASPVLYAGYILASARLTRGVPAVLSSALVHSGAAVTLTIGLLLFGPRRLPPGPTAWAIVVVIAVLPSMLGISLLLAGIARVGATRAAILSTVEPVVTIALAMALLGDRLNALQLVGAVLVLAAVVLMQWRRRQALPPFEP
jgi:drug/metabolite transporter (DMT)-like permease